MYINICKYTYIYIYIRIYMYIHVRCKICPRAMLNQSHLHSICFWMTISWCFSARFNSTWNFLPVFSAQTRPNYAPKKTRMIHGQSLWARPFPSWAQDIYPLNLGISYDHYPLAPGATGRPCRWARTPAFAWGTDILFGSEESEVIGEKNNVINQPFGNGRHTTYLW